MQPNEARVEFVTPWKKENPSVVFCAFLDLLNANAVKIRQKAKIS